MLDYIAVPKRRPGGLRADRRRPGPRRRAGRGRDPRRRARPSSASLVSSVDVSGACFGTVALDAIVDGAAVRAGRLGDRPALLRDPLQRLHAGPLCARRHRPRRGPDGRLGRPLGEVLLEPTEIYVKPIVELLRSEVDVRGLAHITSGGVGNLLPPRRRGRLRDRRAAARPADLRADPGARRRLRRGDARRLQHGLRLLPSSSPADDEAARWSCCALTTRSRGGGSGARSLDRSGSIAPEAGSPRPGAGGVGAVANLYGHVLDNMPT